MLPRLDGKSTSSFHIPSAKLSSFRPSSPVALRNGLFRSPETAALLRAEAVDRFLRWREVEKAVEVIWKGSLGVNSSGRRAVTADSARLVNSGWGRSITNVGHQGASKKVDAWNKVKWEAEWMEDHAQEVARRMRVDKSSAPGRSRTGTMLPPMKAVHAEDSSRATSLNADSILKEGAPVQYQTGTAHAGIHTSFDPLHLPSLFIFSVSLLGPLRVRVWASVKSTIENISEAKVQMALFGGFCIGVGAGMWVRS